MPAHRGVERDPDFALELDVGNPATPVVDADGHLRLVWAASQGTVPETGTWTRYAVGPTVIAGLLIAAVAAAAAAPGGARAVNPSRGDPTV